MPKYQVCAVLLLLLSGSWTPLLAQLTPPPMACTAEARSTPLLRAEGLTDLVGDVIIRCEGGTPIAVGETLRQINFQIFTSPSINITSRLLGSTSEGLFSEALLFIDEPAPANQLVCPPATGPASPECTPIAGTYRGNAFQGTQAGANSLIWQGVPINPPGEEEEDDPDNPGQKRKKRRTFRITNVRVNASQVGQGASRETTNISIVPFISPGPGSPPINFPVVPIRVGVIQPSVTFSVLPQSVPHCEPQNAGLPNQPATGGRIMQVRFFEAYASSFKRRNVALPNPFDGPPGEPIAQDVLGFNYSTESGYMKAPVPGAQTPTAGSADHGTRLIARFTGVQSGVPLWTETAPRLLANGTTTGLRRSSVPVQVRQGSRISPPGVTVAIQ